MEPSPTSATYGKRAFTLLQLLVAVAVMAILMGLLIPAVGKVRQQAKQVGCLSHLRQIGIALNSFAMDHRNRYPAGHGPRRNPPDPLTWMAKLAPYAGLQPGEVGALPLPRSKGIFVCPAFSHEEWARRDVSYRYNANIPSVWNLDRRAIPYGKVFIIVETEGQNADYFDPAIEPVARRHPGGASNFLFTDGRVETYRSPIPAHDLRWGSNRNADYGD